MSRLTARAPVAQSRRLVLAAANGGTLREKLSGTACQSVLEPPTIASDQTFVIEGGTGPFQYATGHGSMTGTSVFSTGNYPVTSSGSTTFTEGGRIELNLSARLSATPAKCVQAALPARVTGKGIASVEWSLNGTPVKGHTVRRKTRYAALVKLSPGRHRLTARVTFIAPGLAPAQTFHRTVLGAPQPRRCSPADKQNSQGQSQLSSNWPSGLARTGARPSVGGRNWPGAGCLYSPSPMKL